MDDLDKYLRSHIKKQALVAKDQAEDFIQIVVQAQQKGFEQVLLDKLGKTDDSVFKYLKTLYEFLLYLDQTKINKNRLLADFHEVEAKFTALKGLKDLVVHLFANQFPLKTIIQKLLEILPVIPEQTQALNGTTYSNVTDIIAAKFGKSSKWLLEKVKSSNINEQQAMSIINFAHHPVVKSIYCKDLGQQTIANDISYQSKEFLAEQLWLYNLEKPGDRWSMELANHLRVWNQKNPSLFIRQERIENFYLKVVDSLLNQELKNGLSSEVTEAIKKTIHFIKSVFINCLVLSIWIMKRKQAWTKIIETFELNEYDKESIWKTISLIVSASGLNMPNSLKVFMFYHEHGLLITGLKLKDYLSISREFQNNYSLQNIRKLMLKRTIEHVSLRILEFNKLFSLGADINIQTLLGYEVEILESYQYSIYHPMLHQITIDQLLICCIYSGLILLTGRFIISFKDILERYNKMLIKQEQVSKVNSNLNIIQFYNEYFINDIANKDKIRSSINHIGQIELNQDFINMLIHNDLTRQ